LFILITVPLSKIVKYSDTEKAPYDITNLHMDFFQWDACVLEISKCVKREFWQIDRLSMTTTHTLKKTFTET